jgi:chromate transporter
MPEPTPERSPAGGPAAAAPSLAALCLGFLELGLIGFGGVLPFARRLIVERRGWLDAQEFADLLGLCQILPGGNIINLSVAVGLQFHGPFGAFACVMALISVPAVLVVGVGSLYAEYAHVPVVRNLFAGVAAAAAGLLIAMALRLAQPLARTPLLALLGLACFAAIALLRLPMLPVVLVLAPLGVLIARRAQA